MIPMRMTCKNDKIGEMTQSIIENDGEGVIFQQKGSQYQAGRSQMLIKLKVNFFTFLIVVRSNNYYCRQPYLIKRE